jgi:hypothetical protein
MGCSHKKAVEIANGTWDRKRRSIITYDCVKVFRCESCGAIRLDQHNNIAYLQGAWSKGGKHDKG